MYEEGNSAQLLGCRTRHRRKKTEERKHNRKEFCRSQQCIYPVVSIGCRAELVWPLRPRNDSVGLVGLRTESSSSLPLGLEDSLARRDVRPRIICKSQYRGSSPRRSECSSLAYPRSNATN